MVKIESIELITNSTKNNYQPFKKGLLAGIPIAVGYIPIAIAFGLLAKTSGIPIYASLLMSLFIFAGASQFVGVNLLVLGASFSEIILTTFILNSRHFLMSASISQKLENNLSKKWLSVLSFGITDETFMVASVREESKLPVPFMLGLNLIAFGSWNIGTWIGVFLGAGLPTSIQESMGIALYAMFVGLLIPSIKKSKPYFIITLIAIIINSIIYWLPPLLHSYMNWIPASVSTGWSIIITTIISSFIGSKLYPKEESKNE